MTFPFDQAPPEDPCPDCDAPPGHACYPGCPRFTRFTQEDLAFEQRMAGDNPDGC